MPTGWEIDRNVTVILATDDLVSTLTSPLKINFSTDKIESSDSLRLISPGFLFVNQLLTVPVFGHGYVCSRNWRWKLVFFQ